MTDLKIGDRIWAQIGYYDFKPFKQKVDREISSYLIKKVTRSFYLLRGMEWKVRKDEIGTEFFASKVDALRNALNTQEEALEEHMQDSIIPLQKEIKYLNKAIQKEMMKK